MGVDDGHDSRPPALADLQRGLGADAPGGKLSDRLDALDRRPFAGRPQAIGDLQ